MKELWVKHIYYADDIDKNIYIYGDIKPFKEKIYMVENHMTIDTLQENSYGINKGFKGFRMTRDIG